MTYGALAAGLLVVIGGIWFGVSRFTGDPEVPPVVNVPAAPGAQQPGGVPERPDPVKAELALAKDAFDQNKFIEPQGESALDLYRSALALDPSSQARRTVFVPSSTRSWNAPKPRCSRNVWKKPFARSKPRAISIRLIRVWRSWTPRSRANVNV